MIENTKISVVTVCYNAVETIEKTILSVINQTYTNVEYIVIDGGSIDGTVNIIEKYASHLTYWISEADMGIYDAMNKGILVATGDYINFMNAGDCLFSKDTIQQFINSCPQMDVVYGFAMYVMGDLTFRFKNSPISEMKNKMPFCHQAVFTNTQLLKKELFDIRFRSSGDYNLYYNLYKQKYTFQCIDVVVATFDASTGISKTAYKLVMRENALIKGNDHKIFWKCKYRLTIGAVKMRFFLKKILPSVIVCYIKKRNLQKYSDDKL